LDSFRAQVSEPLLAEAGNGVELELGARELALAVIALSGSRWRGSGAATTACSRPVTHSDKRSRRAPGSLAS
jgi:hypothetical protein